MKILLIFEGWTDLVFFLHVLRKFEFEEINKEESKYNEYKSEVLSLFKRIVEIPFIRVIHKKEKDIVLAPLGGKENIKKVVKDKFFKEIKERFEKVIVIADKDMEKRLLHIPSENKVIYRNILEDIILETLTSDEKDMLERVFKSIENIKVLRFDTEKEKLI